MNNNNYNKTIYKLIQEPYTLKQLTYSIIGQDNKILINKK